MYSRAFSKARVILKTGYRFAVIIYILLMVGYLVLRLIFGDGFWWLAFLNAIAHLLYLPLLILFPVAVLFDRRSALRLAPLVLVALLWFAPYLLPKQAVAVDDSALKVITFNVWGNNPRLADVENWLRETEADVILLQEIPEQYSLNGLPDLFDIYPYQLVQSLEMREWGNAVLSRHPFEETENFDLEGDGTPSHQRVTLAWGGQLIAIYNIHLVMPIGDQAHLSLPINNPFLNLALKYDDTLRNHEIDQLLARLETEPHPFIVGGDFNTSDQSVIYHRMAAQMRDTFQEIGSGFGGSWPLSLAGEFPSFIPPLLRVDYIWHSDHFGAVDARQGLALGSDHLGLVATLILKVV